MARDLVGLDIPCDEADAARASTPEEEAARWARFEALMASKDAVDDPAAAPASPPRASAPASRADMLAAFRASVAGERDRVAPIGLPSASLRAQRLAEPTSGTEASGAAGRHLAAPAAQRDFPCVTRHALAARLPHSLRETSAPTPKGAARRDWRNWRHRAEGAALAGGVAALCLALVAPGAPETPGSAPVAPERPTPVATAASSQDYAALQRIVAEVVAHAEVSRSLMETAPLMSLSLDTGGAPLGVVFGPVDPWASSADLRAVLSLGLMRMAPPTDAMRASLDASQG